VSSAESKRGGATAALMAHNSCCTHYTSDTCCVMHNVHAMDSTLLPMPLLTVCFNAERITLHRHSSSTLVLLRYAEHITAQAIDYTRSCADTTDFKKLRFKCTTAALHWCYSARSVLQSTHNLRSYCNSILRNCSGASHGIYCSLCAMTGYTLRAECSARS
jgi:hypothetical protein